MNECYKTQSHSQNALSEIRTASSEKQVSLTFSYAPDIQKIPISLTTCVFDKECDYGFYKYKSGKRCWVWYHARPESLAELWPIEERLFNDLWNNQSIRGSNEAREKIKLYYLLMCHGPLVMRGFSCITIMLYTLLSMRQGFKTMPAKIDIAEPNCMAISMSISKGLSEFDHWFESPQEVERCLKFLTPEELTQDLPEINKRYNRN